MKKKLVSLFAGLFAFGLASSALAAPPKGQIGAYVWVGDATGKAPPATSYSFNSAGKANTVKKNSTGVYEVTLEAIGTGGGHAIAQAYGAGSAYCKAQRWNQSGANQSVLVNCFDKDGNATDTQFSLLFIM